MPIAEAPASTRPNMATVQALALPGIEAARPAASATYVQAEINALIALVNSLRAALINLQAIAPQ